MSTWYAFPAVVAAALVLDAVVGDPRWLPHPVRWIGTLTIWLECLLRRPGAHPAFDKAAGACLWVLVVGATFIAASVALWASEAVWTHLWFVVAVFITWSSLAARSLGAEASAVVTALETEGLEAARTRLSMIVGRDTASMTRAEVLRAVSETVSENTSDGIVAPLFFLMLGGPPLMLAYKAVNTLDSMVGYRSQKYLNFGWFSARMDDAANYVPARVTAALVVVSSAVAGYDWRGSVRVLVRDGRMHSSPNSGLPEAAVAGALGVVFGGEAAYGGVVSVKPHIGDGAEPNVETVSGAVRIMWCTTVLMAAMVVFISCFSGFLPIVIL